MGSYPDGLDERRAEALQAIRAMAGQVATLAQLDARRIFPLGYSVVATRPGAGPIARPPGDRTPPASRTRGGS
jgi:hypothetical protein